MDVILGVERVPASNEKVVARREVVVAGGPAANAAATCAFLGGRSTLVTGVGTHPLGAGISADLVACGVTVVDAESSNLPPPTSAIMITESTGERAVVSINAIYRDLAAPAILAELVASAAVVLVDGHHPRLALEAVHSARDTGALTVLDGGSWKAVTSELLPFIDVAVCSADFRPPGVGANVDVLDYLTSRGVRCSAITRGARSVLWACEGQRGDVQVGPGPVVDTLGAGDVFHGALVHALTGSDRSMPADRFRAALEFAASVATVSCQSFGTRSWMSSVAKSALFET
ncbi:MAG: PfkB family carbohydrate kinase [Candidatus Eremiobacteraeota bacterium]|nr:PfkB family carbohydrate kinase [Candidatus Eremiobacteraeota bacterium]